MPAANTAADFVPDSRSLPVLAAAAGRCHGCELYRHATQEVFGEGLKKAAAIFIGEQPGDIEDRQGRPFVGPAGRILDRAMQDAGIDRRLVYVTNAVKHFKFTTRGKRRLHAKPSSREVDACMPWLEAEFQAIRPQVAVCLGATAAQALLGRSFRVTRHRGEIVTTDWAPVTIATFHPSAVLRAHGDNRDHMFASLVEDLQQVAPRIAR